jgi:HK97 family phage prohead protease
MNIKDMTNKAELEQYAETPPSGRGGSIIINKDTLLKSIKPISLRKPMIMLVGSLATQGKSNNDIDIVIRGEDFSEKLQDAINFRLYRYFTSVLGCKYDDITKYVHIHYNNAGSYTSYVPLFELNLVPIRDPQVIEMNSMHMDIKGGFDVINKAEDSRRIIAGYASVIETDKDNDIIPKGTLQAGIESLLRDSEYSNLMLIHQNIQIGKIIKGYGNLSTHVDDNGLFIVAEIRKDLDTSNKVWDKIMDGTLNGFSIAGEILLSHDECDERQCVKVIDKLNIFEVSVCDKPVNSKSGFVVVSKGESLPIADLCNYVIKNEDIQMAKDKEVAAEENCEECEDKAEPAVVAKPEIEPEMEAESTGELSLAETIEELSREVIALRGIIEEMQKKEEPEDEEIEEEEIEEEEEDMEAAQEQPIVEEIQVEPEPQEDKAKPKEEEEEEEPSKYPYPSKKDFDELKKSVDSILSSLKKSVKIDKLEKAITSKDEEITKLTEKVKMLEESEVEPKTITESEEVKNVSVGPKLVKDSLGKGVYYKTPDY